jgi:hypothetical protein
VAPVEGEDQVEMPEVGVPDLARDRRHRHAARRADAPGPQVGRLALVVAVGARRVHLEVGAAARLLSLLAEDGLGQRRAADVAGAHEEQPLRG